MTDFDPEIHRLGMKLKFVYSLVGLLVGACCILAGVILGLGGVVGHTSWTASALGFTTNITDAAPGVIVFVVGIFFVLITRFKVRHVVNRPNTSSTTPQPVSPTPETAPTEPDHNKVETQPEKAPPAHAGSQAPSYSSGGQSSLTYTTHTKF